MTLIEVNVSAQILGAPADMTLRKTDPDDRLAELSLKITYRSILPLRCRLAILDEQQWRSDLVLT